MAYNKGGWFSTLKKNYLKDTLCLLTNPQNGSYLWEEKGLAPNIFETILFQLTTCQLRILFICSFSHMISLMNYVICLNNMHE